MPCFSWPAETSERPAPTPGHRTIEMAAAGRDVKRIKARTAETALVRQVRRDRMSFDHRAGRRKNVHQRTRPAALPAADRDDVAVAIEAHALDSAMLAAMIFAENVENDGMLERAVGADRVGTQLARLLRTRQAVGDVKRALVVREQHRAGADGVVGEPRRRPGAAVVAFKAQHRAVVKEWKDRWPERNDGMAGIGEIDAVLPIDNKVARLIMVLAVKERIDRDRAPIGGELDKPAPALLRAVYLTVRSARKAVDAVGVAPEFAHCLARVVQPEQPPSSTVLNSTWSRVLSQMTPPADPSNGPATRSNSHAMPRSYQTGTPGMLRRVRNTE